MAARGDMGSREYAAWKARADKLQVVADKADRLSVAKADAEDLFSELVLSRKRVSGSVSASSVGRATTSPCTV